MSEIATKKNDCNKSQQTSSDRIVKKKKNQYLVFLKRNQAKTTSLLVAEKFNKRHDNVLRDIENLIQKDQEDRLKFEEIFYIDKINREQKLYEMDRKSFSILVMGFEGEKAFQWKLDFYDSFEAMEKWITTQFIMQSDSERKAIREEGKFHRRLETDTIKDFVQYCIGQGSKNFKQYYLAISKMVNESMFIRPPEMPKPENFRNILTKAQLIQVSTADIIVENALKGGMAQGLYYKKVFKLAKERIQTFVEALGGKVKVMQPQLSLFDLGIPAKKEMVELGGTSEINAIPELLETP